MLCAIDIETTGLDPRSDCIIAMGAVALDRELVPVAKWQRYIRPHGRAVIGEEAAKINGYSEATWAARDALEIQQALAELASWFADGGYGDRIEWLAHNAPFDRSFVDPALATWDFPHRCSRRWRCSMAAFQLYQDVVGIGVSASLANLAQLAGHWDAESERAQHHDALHDATACAVGYRWLVRQLQARGDDATNGQLRIQRSLLRQAQAEIDRLSARLSDAVDPWEPTIGMFGD